MNHRALVVFLVFLFFAASAAIAWGNEDSCCTPDNRCEEGGITEQECMNLGGDFYAGTLCQDNPQCAPVPGACCLDNQCLDIGNHDCPPEALFLPGETCESANCGEGIACRVTGGGVDTSDTWDGSYGEGKYQRSNGEDRYTFGGQAGAPTAAQPQPYGEWTHHQQRGPSGNWVFHAGTASAPPGTEIDVILCSDPDFCDPARPAPAKQIDFEGVGTFKNLKNAPAAFDNVIPGETFHWFSVHIEDLGEPGKAGKVDPPAATCPPGGSPGAMADCDCPDFYHITIHETADPASPVMYDVMGYITGGNLQIHPPIGT